jgi:hypothetical protein
LNEGGTQFSTFISTWTRYLFNQMKSVAYCIARNGAKVVRNYIFPVLRNIFTTCWRWLSERSLDISNSVKECLTFNARYFFNATKLFYINMWIPFIQNFKQWTVMTYANVTYWSRLVYNRIVVPSFHTGEKMLLRLSLVFQYISNVWRWMKFRISDVLVRILVRILADYMYPALCHGYQFFKCLGRCLSTAGSLSFEALCIRYHWINLNLRLFADWLSDLVFNKVVTSVQSFYHFASHHCQASYNFIHYYVSLVSSPLGGLLTSMKNITLLCFRRYIINGFLVHFTRAWWRLIPALLSVKTCYLFLSIPISSYFSYFFSLEERPVLSAMIGYALAGWSVGILSVVLMKDAYHRSFRWSNVTNRQFIATSSTSVYYNVNSPIDRMLQHVDMGSIWFMKMSLRKLVQSVIYVYQNFIHWFQRIGRVIFNILKHVWNYLVSPILRKIKQFVLMIWRSPLLCSSTTMIILGLLFAHHQSYYRWEKTEASLAYLKHIFSHHIYATINTIFSDYLPVMMEFTISKFFLVVELISSLLYNTKMQLISAIENKDVKSPRLAYLVWLVIVVAVKATNEVRIKTLK